jgi:hypothetical protein
MERLRFIERAAWWPGVEQGPCPRHPGVDAIGDYPDHLGPQGKETTGSSGISAA